MVKVIMGQKGSGKTKQLVSAINEAVKTESGSVVCIEKSNKLTFDIDYRVRLIDARDYLMGSVVFLQGLISGLHAGNFDISHIFIDNLYTLCGTEDRGEIERFLNWCAEFGEKQNLKFTVSISDDPDAMPAGVQKYF